jgi:hypothetical protein
MGSSTPSGSEEEKKGGVLETKPAEATPATPATAEVVVTSKSEELTGFDKILKERVGKDTNIVPGVVLAAVDSTGICTSPCWPQLQKELTSYRRRLLLESLR